LSLNGSTINVSWPTLIFESADDVLQAKNAISYTATTAINQGQPSLGGHPPSF